MENERNTDKLAGYIIKLGGLAMVLALCWYFKNVLIYIIVAFVVSMIGRPLMQLMRKIKIKGKSAPDWLLALLSIILIFFILTMIVTQMVPLVSNIVRDASAIETSSYFESNPIDKVNEWLIGMFPNLGEDFDLSALLMDKIRELVDFGKVSGIVGSVASLVTSAFVALFAIASCTSNKQMTRDDVYYSPYGNQTRTSLLSFLPLRIFSFSSRSASHSALSFSLQP